MGRVDQYTPPYSFTQPQDIQEANEKKGGRRAEKAKLAIMSSSHEAQ